MKRRRPVWLLSPFIGVLWLASSSLAQTESVERIVQQMPSRQADALAEIAGLTQAATFDQVMSGYFLKTDAERTNRLLASYSPRGITLPQFSVMIRLLHAEAQSASRFLDEAALTNLEQQAGRMIEQGGPLFQRPWQMPFASDSQRFLSLANLTLWADYIQSASTAFDRPAADDRTPYWEAFSQNLHHWLDKSLQNGPQERSSPYYSFYLAGLLNLVDFSSNKAVASKAQALVDMLLTDVAHESLGHQWGGTQSRILDMASHPTESRLHWVFFGLKSSLQEHSSVSMLTYHLAATGYRPPSVLVRLITQWHERPVYTWRSHFTYRSTLHGDDKQFYKYSRVTPKFILSSFQLQNELVPWQSRPWDLMIYEENEPEDHFFAYAGDQLFSGGVPPFDEAYYRWNSTSLQYQNVLYVEFHRSDRKRPGASIENRIVDERYVQPVTRLWIPNSFTPITENEGWWFCRRGEVYLAFRPIEGKAYWWQSTKSPSPYESGAAIMNFQNLHTGMLLEVEEASRFSSFEQFQSQVLSSPLEVEEDSVTFVSRRGDVLLFPRGEGEFLVNGKPYFESSKQHYAVFSSPYAHYRQASQTFEVHWPPFSLLLDFTNLNAPKRVIKP